MALLGVALLAVALLAGLSMRASSTRLAHQTTPALGALVDAESGLRSTLASLRGWLATGEPGLRDSGRAAWSEEVWPAFDRAQALLQGPEREALASSRRLAADLAEWQWIVGDAAHRPGNRLGEFLIASELRPKARRIRLLATRIIDIEKTLPPSPARRRFLTDVADYRGATAAAHSALQTQVTAVTRTGAAAEYDALAKRSADRLRSVFERRSLATPEQREAMDELERLEAVYLRLAERVRRIAASSGRDVAAQLLATEALPRAEALSRQLAEQIEPLRLEQAQAVASVDRVANVAVVLLLLLTGGMAGLAGRLAQRSSTGLVRRVTALRNAIAAFQRGEPAEQLRDDTGDEIADLAAGFESMRADIARTQEDLSERLAEISGQNRQRTLLTELSSRVRDTAGAGAVSSSLLAWAIEQTGALVGGIWSTQEGKLLPVARHGWDVEPAKAGGLLRQVASDQQARWLDDVAPEHLAVASGLGLSRPTCIALLPLVHGSSLGGVLELAWLEPPEASERELLEEGARIMGAALVRELASDRIEGLLKTAQTQAEELQVQAEELRVSNEELEQRSSALERSEGRLQTQSEELRVINEELEERGRELALRGEELSRKNSELEAASELVRLRAEELERTGRYKSEFLANMSHELRTPLNSIIVLAGLLAENGSGGLTPKQVEFATTIRASGNDLLSLINEVLDLSRVEAGRLDLDLEEVPPDHLLDDLAAQLRPQADAKGLDFDVQIAPDTPALRVDPARVSQILRNLGGNAVKFTDEGSVTIRVAPTPGAAGGRWVGFAVTDSGPGIPEADHERVFDAFQQVDGTVRRRFGGTGLGLSISRELARLHGGRIELRSAPGEGSTFTLLLPVAGADASPAPGQGSERPPGPVSPTPAAPAAPTPPPARAPTGAPPAAELSIPPLPDGALVLLIVEDDAPFAAVLADLAQTRGFHPVVARDGEVGLQLARRLLPAAMLLDLGLPRRDGGDVLRALRADPRTRRIPVHVVSAQDRPAWLDQLGTAGFLTKPASPDGLREVLTQLRRLATVSRLLIVEDDDGLRTQLAEMFAADDLEVVQAGSAAEARAALAELPVDCVVLDLGLPDSHGIDLLKELDLPDLGGPPVVVYTGRDLSPEELREVERRSASIVIKTARSPERLLEETRLFLHRVHGSGQFASVDLSLRGGLGGRRVLLVDDDMRNIYALSELLEGQQVDVLVAADGQECLDLLEGEQPDLIVMDMMMPVMDGYEAMRRIRADGRWASLPIVGLTAKATKQDRIDCLDAGASDYLTKPVDPDRLLSVLEVWLAGAR